MRSRHLVAAVAAVLSIPVGGAAAAPTLPPVNRTLTAAGTSKALCYAGVRSGKGVATTLGVYAVLAPPLMLIGIAVFLLIAGRTKVVALGSLSGMAAATVAAFVEYPEHRVLAFATLALSSSEVRVCATIPPGSPRTRRAHRTQKMVFRIVDVTVKRR